jgi:GNAT superfamily N-acetyltransferase
MSVKQTNVSMDVRYEESPALADDELNALWSAAWPSHESREFAGVLARSLVYIVARHGDRLIGFVHVAWDGDEHGFLLDPTVDPAFRRRGIGTQLVRRAASVARARNLKWLHVDFLPELTEFYSKAGFQPSAAGVMRLQDR